MVSSAFPDNLAMAAEPETLQIKNDLSELERVSDWVANLSAQWGLSPRLTFSLDLVLAEAVTNIIENAYTDEAEHVITLGIRSMPPIPRVEIADDGQPFNPLDHPAVVQPQSLEEAEVGGLGIHLIRRYAETCHYQRQGTENCFTIVLRETA